MAPRPRRRCRSPTTSRGVAARILFDAPARLDRRASAPHIELARSYLATHERQLALRAANKAVALDPRSSTAHNTLGRAELLRHGYDAAIARSGSARPRSAAEGQRGG